MRKLKIPWQMEKDFYCDGTRANFVMAGLVPAIHGLRDLTSLKAWMAGTRPAMTGLGHRT